MQWVCRGCAAALEASRLDVAVCERVVVPLSAANFQARAPEAESTVGAARCVICMEDDKDQLFLPCKHVCCCARCANAIALHREHAKRICPMCRAPIETVISGVKF